jgi:N-acetylmuramoyl-L-alanine amidase
MYTAAVNKGKKVLGISIHADALSGQWGTPNGHSIFYYSKAGEELGKYINSSISIQNIKSGTVTTNRGVKFGDLFMCRDTKGIWVLLESGFMDNISDLKHLRSDSYRNELAVSILLGFCNYANKA